MPTPMISEQWPRFVLPIVRREWYNRLIAVPSPASQFYGIERSTSSVEYSQGIGSGGLVPEYNSSAAEGKAAAIEYDSFNPLYEKTFTHKEYAKGLEIGRKLYDDNQSGLIRRKAATLGDEYGTTRATHMASVFNNAFSSSYLGADGKALCATDHPTSPTVSTAVVNKGTSALSYAAIVATMQAGKKMKDDRGNPLPFNYDVLYVPVELEATAIEETKGLLKPGIADNTASALQGAGLRIVADPYLTDANNWFMIDSMKSNLHLLWFDRVSPELSMDPTSDFNLVARYRGYMRYSFGWDSFQWVYGHEV